jgi:uncharacterized membrane protein
MGMHRIALIQNESEMMRYSWADIRPLLSRLEYPFDSYTAENLAELFPRLNKHTYDAIIIATNACNDKQVREALAEEHNRSLAAFLRSGGGMLVSFQMRLADYESYEFVPAPFGVSATNRIRVKDEDPTTGDLQVNEDHAGHVVLRYPNQISIQAVKDRCLQNNLVEGIYWTYLQPEDERAYTCLLQDTSFDADRQLLIVSREDFPARVLVSSLALDWQMHWELWENCVRYVVEGRPTIAIVSKEASSAFDFRYLVTSLGIKKLPFVEYSQQHLSATGIPLDIHNTVVLDPSWHESDIASFSRAHSDQIRAAASRLYYFGQTPAGDISVSTVSRVKEFDLVARNVITWLVHQFPEEEGKGYWEDSFWCTVDVLDTLTEFNQPVDQFKDRILTEIARHNREGSYDKVLGASCAMLEVFHLFLGKSSQDFQTTLEWIMDRVYSKTYFEQATAFDVLGRLGIDVPQNRKDAFRNEAMAAGISSQNDFLLYRYAKSLLACGFVVEAEQLALRLAELQDRKEGKWVNVPNTASVLHMLMILRNASQKPSRTIDEVVFRGIQFIKSAYLPDGFNWKGDVSATAKSLKALKHFEDKITFPIDEVLSGLQVGVTAAESHIAIDVAADLNVKLQRQNNRLAERLREREQKQRLEARERALAIRLAVILAIPLSATAALGLAFLAYLVSNDLLGIAWTHLAAFLHDWALVILPGAGLAPIILLLLILRRFRMLPWWLAPLLARLGIAEDHTR